ncbi:MAG: thiol:disulfide interchange protein DsbC [Flavobacteriales bacterium]|jgi:thiol:disulfide interchange protein DsbC
MKIRIMKIVIEKLVALALVLFSVGLFADEPAFNLVNDGENQRLVLGQSFSFNSGSVKLSEKADSSLTELVAFLKTQKVSAIRVEGHSDSVRFNSASDRELANNWSLSAARAGSVASALVDLGVSPGLIYAVGMSDTKPRANNKTAQGRRANRRIELVLEGLTGAPVAENPEAQILRRLTRARPDLKFDKVVATESPDIYEVQFNQGGVIYSTRNGGHFFAGEFYKVGKGNIVNLTDRKKSEARKEMVAQIDRKSLITFKPEGEIKSDIFVFTDVDCSYCRLLHKEMASYMDAGIQVHYLAYPRGGMNSGAAQKMVSAWCAKDRLKAISTLKSGGTINPIACDDHPVGEHFMLGQRAGVTGTPAILLDSGELLPGYVTADKLSARLGLN